MIIHFLRKFWIFSIDMTLFYVNFLKLSRSPARHINSSFLWQKIRQFIFSFNVLISKQCQIFPRCRKTYIFFFLFFNNKQSFMRKLANGYLSSGTLHLKAINFLPRLAIPPILVEIMELFFKLSFLWHTKPHCKTIFPPRSTIIYPE